MTALALLDPQGDCWNRIGVRSGHSCIVYGMPRTAAELQAAMRILLLPHIAGAILAALPSLSPPAGKPT